MPWPAGGHDGEEEDIDAQESSLLTYDTWLLNDIDFGWLLESDGNIASFSETDACSS